MRELTVPPPCVAASAARSHDPRSPILRAFVAGLAIDETDRAAGRADGAAGRPFSPGDHDILSYASGYHAGRTLGV